MTVIAETDTGHLPLITLEQALVGQTVSLEKLADPDQTLLGSLADMGLPIGAVLKVIDRGPGPFTVAVGEARLVLARGLVSRLIVRPRL